MEGSQEQVLLHCFTRKVVTRALSLLQGGRGEQMVVGQEVQVL